MKKIYLLNFAKSNLVALITFLLVSFMGGTVFGQTQTVVFNSGGTYSWTPPCGVTSFTVSCWGAGANGFRGQGGGGGGAYATKTFNSPFVAPYAIYVGRGGGTYGGGFFSDPNYNGESSVFGANDVVAEGAGNYNNNNNNYKSGGRASASIPTLTAMSGGNGGQSGGNGGAGGGGSAGSLGLGGNGNSTASNAGGAGGTAGGGGGASGGNGGSSYNGGNPGNIPGAGGGERGAFSFNSSGNGADGQVIITYTGVATYCTPDINYQVWPITNVTFGLGSNTSSNTIGGTTPAFETFCTPLVNITLNTSYNLSVKSNTGNNIRFYYTAFIDWNQNGVFEASERYDVGNTTDGNTGRNISITVPGTATLGTTKMRVLNNYNINPTDPCGTYNYGQVEDYIINVSGSCQQPTGVSVTDGTTTSATGITICSGTKIFLTQTGGTLGLNQEWKWYTVIGGTAVNTNTISNASFTPSPTSTTTYYVRAEGGTCGSTGTYKSVTVTVNAAGTISLASASADAQVCIGDAIPSIVYNLSGGAVPTATSISWDVTPAGTISLAFSSGKVTLQGTPTAAGIYKYTITPGGNSPCTNAPATVTGTITVNKAPTSVTYTSPVKYCLGAQITDNSPFIGLGTAIPANYVIQGTALPPGLNLDATTGKISGTPTGIISAAQNYTIKASNTCGFVLATVNIEISNGDNVYNMTPTGISNVCSAGYTGTVITLINSDNGVSYQLLNGTTVVDTKTGTGSGFSFTNQMAAGTYTVRTSSGCKTNMNGTLTVNISQQPATTFSYSNYSYCQSGISVTPTFGNSPTTGGTFSSSPAGLVWYNNDNTTGIVDLALSAANSYTISYTIPSAGPCGNYTFTRSTQLVINASPKIYNVYGGGGYCSGGTGSDIGLDNSETGVSYQLYLGAGAVGAPKSGTNGSVIDFGNQTAPGAYTVTAKRAGCSIQMNGTATVTVYPNPAITILPATPLTLCQGTIQALTATSVPAGTNPDLFASDASGNINLDIPDNDPTGVYHVLRITGIPNGATIKNVSINFTVTQSKGNQLRINLKGPNGNVLNIANQLGNNTTGNFTNTTISSNATTNIAQGAPPYSDPAGYLPGGDIGIDGAVTVAVNQSNVTLLSGLYGSSATSANGDWIFSVRDVKKKVTGTLSNCSITITYTTVSNPVNVTWSPVTDLYSDPGATIPYDGITPLSTVYSKPSGGNLTYTATASNGNGCTTTATKTITVKQSPKLTMTADYCSVPGKIKVTANSDINVDKTKWVWSNGAIPLTPQSPIKSIINVDLAGNYFVTATADNGCSSTNHIKVAQELVENGDFEQGYYGFSTGYNYVDNTTQNGLVPQATYTVNNNPNFNHYNFWGVDHTTANGTGNYMLINGTSNTTVWKQTVTVIPGTDYYFAAYATSLNKDGNNANLQFKIDGSPIGNPTGPLADKELINSTDDPTNWKRFYGGPWNSGSLTSVEIEIIDLQNAGGGNDFGLDDISFATLSSFISLTSPTGTDNQLTVCANSPVTPISYDMGGDGNLPSVSYTLNASAPISGVPAGILTKWDGRTLTLSGTLAPGVYTYSITTSGCQPKTATGKIKVLQPSSVGTFAGATNGVISVCYNTGGAITLSGSVGNVIWKSSIDGVTFSNPVIGNPGVNYPALTSAMYYQATATNGTGCTADVKTVKIGLHNLWTGKASADWNTGTNWSDEKTPTFASSCDDVIIPVVTGLSVYPILTTGTISVKNLRVMANASLTVDNAILQVSGSITSTKGITATTGTIELNGGPTAQNISGDYFSDKKIKNLTLSNSANVIGFDTLKIVGQLGFSAATAGKTFAAGTSNVSLLSSFTGTANVAELMNNNKITGGNFTVERYINTGVPATPGTHGKSWQLLAFPTIGQSIHDAWQEKATSGMDNPNPGYGIELTSANVATTTNGYDAKTPGSSLKMYNSSIDQYDPVLSTKAINNLANTKGYYVYVRGDRTVTALNGNPANSTVIRSTGTLNTGDQAAVPIPKGRYGTVGNPYAAPIDLRVLHANSTNITNEIYLWDPTFGGNYGAGGFITLTWVGPPAPSGNGYYRLASSQNPTGTYPGLLVDTMQSGQAFFMKANTVGDASITFKENVKVDGNAGGRLVNGINGIEKPVSILEANLSGTPMGGGNAQFLDGALAIFGEEYSNQVDWQDGAKISNGSNNVGFLQGGKFLSVERRQLPTATDTLNLYLTNSKVQAYTWNFSGENINVPGLTAYLWDKYLNTETPINLNTPVDIGFTITNVAASKAADRFKIVFGIAKPLPVTITTVKATRNTDKTITVNWKVENEINIVNYGIQHSADGVTFTNIGTTPPANSNGNTGSYDYGDANPLSTANYYRIKALSKDGQVQYSNVVKVNPLSIPGSITVYPNPVQNKEVNMLFVNEPAGTYQLELTNKIGQAVYKGKVTISTVNEKKKVSLVYVTAAGVYHLNIKGPDGTMHTLELVVEL